MTKFWKILMALTGLFGLIAALGALGCFLTFMWMDGDLIARVLVMGVVLAILSAASLTAAVFIHEEVLD